MINGSWKARNKTNNSLKRQQDEEKPNRVTALIKTDKTQGAKQKYCLDSLGCCISLTKVHWFSIFFKTLSVFWCHLMRRTQKSLVNWICKTMYKVINTIIQEFPWFCLCKYEDIVCLHCNWLYQQFFQADEVEVWEHQSLIGFLCLYSRDEEIMGEYEGLSSLCAQTVCVTGISLWWLKKYLSIYLSVWLFRWSFLHLITHILLYAAVLDRHPLSNQGQIPLQSRRQEKTKDQAL